MQLAHKGNLQLLQSCQNQLRLGSTASFPTSGPDDSTSQERQSHVSKKRQPFRSQNGEAISDIGYEERVPYPYSEDNVHYSPSRGQEAVTASTKPAFTLESHRGIRDQQQIEYEREVLEALHEENPQRLLEALAQASKYFRYFRDLPTTTLSEIIYMLQPSEFIDREKALYQELHPDHIVALGHGTPQLTSLFEDYANSMQRLMLHWKASGKHFGLKEYKAFLNVARAVGDGSVANGIWNELRRENIPLDTEAVNLFMEARCWSGAYSPGYGHNLRVTKLNQEKRSLLADEETPREPGFEGFRVGVFGIRAEMTAVFDEMVDQGLNPDADTFMHLMVAMGREGDLAGAKSILQRVWAIDVDEIVGAQEELPEKSAMVSPSSALYPSERLLYIVAHVFGSNNDASTALRVVDYISYKYDIPIDLKTWQELVSWTYVLSAPRSQGPEEKKVDLRTGQLPITAMSDLWKVMRSPPYNVQPSTTMFFQRISNLRKRAFLQPMLNTMREMRVVHQAQVERYKQSMIDCIRAMLRGRLNSSKKPYFSLDQQCAALERSADLRLERLAEFRDFTCMKRALSYLLEVQRWTSRHGPHFYNVLWQRIGVHNAIAEFGCYMDRLGYRYHVRTGEIHIQPIRIAMAVDLTESSIPGIQAVNGTNVYHLTSSKYERYGSLGSMHWDDVEFEDDEEDFGDHIARSWLASEAQDGNHHDESTLEPLDSAGDLLDLSREERNEGQIGET